MEIVEITSRVLGARCVLLAEGSVAVVVDPGAGVADEVVADVAPTVQRYLAEHLA